MWYVSGTWPRRYSSRDRHVHDHHVLAAPAPAGQLYRAQVGDVAAVGDAFAVFLSVDAPARAHRQALPLPLVEAASEGPDVGVAHTCQRLRRHSATAPVIAAQHDGNAPVRHHHRQPDLQSAPVDRAGAGDLRPRELAAFAHVDAGVERVRGQQGLGGRSVDGWATQNRLLPVGDTRRTWFGRNTGSRTDPRVPDGARRCEKGPGGSLTAGDSAPLRARAGLKPAPTTATPGHMIRVPLELKKRGSTVVDPPRFDEGIPYDGQARARDGHDQGFPGFEETLINGSKRSQAR